MTLHTIADPLPPTVATITNLVHLALRIATRLALAELRQRADTIDQAMPGAQTVTRWHDVRPMLEIGRYTASQACDHGQSITYLIESGLVQRHPDDPMRLRITHEG